MGARFGLIGYPLEHSFSKAYFTHKFASEGIAATYDNFPLQSMDQFAGLCGTPGLIGLNVTRPYKREVIPLLDVLHETASGVGAVNTILLTEQKVGYNTDVFGVQYTLQGWLDAHVNRALILGTGGAARAVRYVLDGMKIRSRTVSRQRGKADLTYRQLTPEHIREVQLIVNTTPLGTYPDIGSCPEIPYDGLGPQHYLFDLVYNPEKTLFLKRGEEHRAQIKNGLDMLHIQADRAWEIWKPHLKTQDGT
ncbi:MAG: shikimate dehydrogenase [Saprospiraceae bacterium]|nr:shikimate dehydrogenase [Saprospiraceae bacterium]